MTVLERSTYNILFRFFTFLSQGEHAATESQWAGHVEMQRQQWERCVGHSSVKVNVTNSPKHDAFFFFFTAGDINILLRQKCSLAVCHHQLHQSKFFPY